LAAARRQRIHSLFNRWLLRIMCKNLRHVLRLHHDPFHGPDGIPPHLLRHAAFQELSTKLNKSQINLSNCKNNLCCCQQQHKSLRSFRFQVKIPNRMNETVKYFRMSRFCVLTARVGQEFCYNFLSLLSCRIIWHM